MNSTILNFVDSVTSLFVRKMVTAAGPAVVQADLLGSVGFSPDNSVDPKAKIAASAYYNLLERIANEVDVTDLPLRVGASMRCDDYGVLG